MQRLSTADKLAPVTSRRLDGVAIGLSALCLIHCLALPLLISLLPIAGLFGFEDEWVHKVLVIAVVPVTALAAWSAGHRAWSFLTLAGLGITLLLAGAFVHPLHDFEVPLTVVGALLVAAAHAHRWYSGSHDAATLNR